MVADIPYVLLIIGTVLVGLWFSNILYDLKVPHYISRKIGHCAGGVGFLIAGFAFDSARWPIILSFSFGLILWLARIVRPYTFRGVGGSGRPSTAMAEVWFPWVAVPVFAVGWWWFNRPFIAVACLLFMAWGDCVTGLVRSAVYGKAVKGLWGSAAMLVICLALSWAFISPFWIGLVGSVIATFVEWSCGDVGLVKWADDNWAVPLFSLLCILTISVMTGNIIV